MGILQMKGNIWTNVHGATAENTYNEAKDYQEDVHYGLPGGGGEDTPKFFKMNEDNTDTNNGTIVRFNDTVLAFDLLNSQFDMFTLMVATTWSDFVEDIKFNFDNGTLHVHSDNASADVSFDIEPSADGVRRIALKDAMEAAYGTGFNYGNYGLVIATDGYVSEHFWFE